MKKTIALLLALCLMLSLAACGSSTSTETTAGGSATETAGDDGTSSETEGNTSTSEKVVIRFWQAGADTVDATNVMSELLTQFMIENPDIIVEYQAFPWANDPHTTFQTAIAGGDVADVLVVGSPLDQQLFANGQTLALNDYIDQDIIDDLMDVFANECLYVGTDESLEGQFVSMPLYGDARTLLYNKAIFDELGLDYPDESMTHEEFIQLARDLTGELNGKMVYGFGTSAYYSSQYLNFIWNYGGDILTEDYSAPATDTDAWKQGISDYLVFYEEGLTPPGSEAMKLADLLTMFQNGEIAMMVATSDYCTTLRTCEATDGYDPANLGVGIMPHEDYQTAYGGADVLVIPASTEHPEEAARLINFLLREDNQLTYAKAVGFFPAVKSAGEDEYFTSDELRAGFIDALNNSRFYVKTSYSSGVTTILRSTIQELIGGTIDFNEYIDSVTSQLQYLIDENS